MEKEFRGRLSPGMTAEEMIWALSDQKPVTLCLLKKICDENPYKAFLLMVYLNNLGKYGSTIFKQFTDECDENVDKFFQIIMKEVIHKYALTEEN